MTKNFCSIKLDEHPSTRTRRYININLHNDEKHINPKMAKTEKASCKLQKLRNWSEENRTSNVSRWKSLLQQQQMGPVGKEFKKIDLLHPLALLFT